MACGSCSSSGGACGSAGCGGNGGCGSAREGTTACPAMHVYDWLNDLGVSSPAVRYDLVEITFKGGRKGIYRNPRHLDVQTGDFVVVEADRGVDFGTVHMSGELVRLRVEAKELDGDESHPNVIRLASLKDIEQWEENKEKEGEAFYVGREAIDRLGLPMKLVDTEWQFDHRKITFYFTADHRVDFRQLVRDLAGQFRTRVELRQIGARDEAARIGGIGSCGRELCCSTWLQEFKPVSTQAAKVQNLPLNPTRLSGQCGRLKCCLNYELEQYMDALQHFPRIDTPVETAYGEGHIKKLDIFTDTISICHRDGTWEDKPLHEVREILELEPGEPARRPESDESSDRGRRQSKPRGRRHNGSDN